MKTLVSLLVFVGMVAPLSFASAEAPQTKTVPVGLNNVFVPGGFGPDSDAYVIASGIYPNTCYKWERADVANVDPMTHEIRTYAQVTQSICLMVLVPFSQEIGLGKLASGTHTLRFLSGDGTYFEKTVSVE
jgi:hypothetical protein